MKDGTAPDGSAARSYSVVIGLHGIEQFSEPCDGTQQLHVMRMEMVSFLQQVEKFLKSPQAVIDFFQCTFHIVIGRVLMESLAQAF
jgi:hypothetical protein